MPSVLWRCWLGSRKGIRPLKTEWWGVGVVVCLEQGADLHMAQLMPLPFTVSCFSKIQIGFTFLVPADLGSPGKRAVKRVCMCVCDWFDKNCRKADVSQIIPHSVFSLLCAVDLTRNCPVHLWHCRCLAIGTGLFEALLTSRFKWRPFSVFTNTAPFRQNDIRRPVHAAALLVAVLLCDIFYDSNYSELVFLVTQSSLVIILLVDLCWPNRLDSVARLLGRTSYKWTWTSYCF